MSSFIGNEGTWELFANLPNLIALQLNQEGEGVVCTGEYLIEIILINSPKLRYLEAHLEYRPDRRMNTGIVDFVADFYAKSLQYCFLRPLWNEDYKILRRLNCMRFATFEDF